MRDLVQRFIGEHEAAKRKTLTADDVTQDDAGLDVLMVSSHWSCRLKLCGSISMHKYM